MARDEAGYIHAVDGIVLHISRSPPVAPVTTPLWRPIVKSIRQIVNSIRRRLRLSGPPNP
jgi:hypothetical protein